LLRLSILCDTSEVDALASIAAGIRFSRIRLPLPDDYFQIHLDLIAVID